MNNELKSSHIGLACLNGRREEIEHLLVERTAEADVVLKGYLQLKKVNNSTAAVVSDAQTSSSQTRLMTPLWIAAATGHDEIVRILLEKRVCVEFKNEVGATALFISSLNGHEKVVKLLIGAGADLECKNNKGQSALYAAAANGHSQIVRLLIDANAELETKNNSGHTAQDAALRSGHQTVVQMLRDAIERCASRTRLQSNDTSKNDIDSSDGQSIGLESSERKGGSDHGHNGHPKDQLGSKDRDGSKGNESCKCSGVKDNESCHDVDKGATGCEVESPKYCENSSNETGSSSMTPDELVKQIANALGQSFGPLQADAVNTSPVTSLVHAAMSGNISAVASLLAQGARADLPAMVSLGPGIGTREVTPLWGAAAKGHEKVVDLLIQKGANVDQMSNSESALFTASVRGHVDVVKRLIKAHAEIKTKNMHGLTALILAAMNGYTEVVRTLLPFLDKAFVDMTEGQGNSALTAASCNGHQQVVELLISYGAKIDCVNVLGRSAIFGAACNGHTGVVRSLLEEHAHVHFIDRSGRSALFAALSNGHWRTAELLLSAGAELATVDLQGITPLHAAACNGHRAAVNLILSNNPTVDNTCNAGRTPLFYASYNGQQETVKMLIEAGADLNIRDSEGHAALHAAAMHGHRVVLELLIEAKADVDTRDNDGHSLLFLVSHHGYTEMADLLIKAGADLEIQDGEGHRALFAASYKGHVDIVDLLIRSGAEVDHRDNEKHTALYAAVETGHAVVVEKLILVGADINCLDFEGYSLLIAAVLNNEEEVAYLLIQAGAKVDVCNKDGRSALYSASQDGFLGLVKLLLASHANVHLKDNWGVDALFSACYGGYYEIAHMLIEAEADVNTTDFKGRTALSVASQNGHYEVVGLLIDQRADLTARNLEGHTSLHLAAYFGYTKVAEVLIASGAGVDVQNAEGETPLTLSSFQGHLDTVQLLISSKANLDAKDISGHTALHVASYEGHESVTQALIEAGADVNAKDSDNHSALHAACHKGYTKIVKMLLGAKVDCNVVSVEGHTPLHFATASGHKDIVQLIAIEGNIAKDEMRWALRNAAANGHKDIVDALMTAMAKNKLTKNPPSGTIHDDPLDDVENSFIHAALNGKHEIVRLLLEKGVNVNVQNREGHTALHAASYRAHPITVKLLISSDADIGQQDEDGNSALMLASRAGCVDIVQMLTEAARGDIEMTNSFGRSALCFASFDGHHEVVNVLLRCGADVNRVDKSGMSSLILASMNGHNEVVNCLLLYGAWVGLPDRSGTTAMMMAAVNGYPDIVERLIFEGANVNTRTDIGVTALISAAHKDHKAVVEVLIKHGADLDLVQDNGVCAAFAAASSGQEEILKLLINSGANLRLESSKGGTLLEDCLQGASHIGHSGVVKILLGLDFYHDIINGCVLNVFVKSLTREKLDVMQLLFRYYLSHNLRDVKSVTHNPQILSLIYSAFFGQLIHAVRSSRSVDVFRVVQLLISGEPAIHCPTLTANFPFQDVIDYSFLSAAAIPDPHKRLVHMSSYPRDFHKTLPPISELIKVPGLGNVECIPDGRANAVFSDVRSVVFEIVEKLKKLTILEGPRKMDNVYSVGSAAEGTNVGLPDEMDFMLQFIISRDEVVIKEVGHGYKLCDIKPDSGIPTADRDAFIRDVGSGSKNFHNGFVTELFSVDLLQHEKLDTPLNFVKGGGHASTEMHVKWQDTESGRPFLVSVDMVPVLYFPSAWPSDAIQSTWLMDTETLKSRGFALVAKPPHKNSEMGRRMEESQRSRLWRLTCAHLETEHISSIEKRVKDAYVAAKCVRNPDVCRILIKDTDGVLRSVDKYVTSYLLKTVFLHNVPDFLASRKSLVCMLNIIYSELVKYLREGFLPLFWQRDANTLEGLSINIKESLRVAELMKQFVGQMYLREEAGEIELDLEDEVVVYTRRNPPPVGYMAFLDDPNHQHERSDDMYEQIIYKRSDRYAPGEIFDFLKGEDGY